MKRFKANENVEPGVYFCLRSLAFRSVTERGRLGGDAEDVYRRVPAFAMLLVAPLLGLAFVLFLPLAGIFMVARLGVEKLRARWARRAQRRPRPSGLPIHLSRSTRIHAPLAKTYSLARDPEHWSDWYVALDEPVGCPVLQRGYQAVGMRFPLCGEIVDERVGSTRAHWRSEMGGPAETVRIGTAGDALVLPGIQDWTYEAVGDETRVTVELDCFMPIRGPFSDVAPNVIRGLEEAGLERSLGNLKDYCEHVN